MNTIIEKIRAEVNRQAKSIDTATGDFAEGRRMEQRHILFFLSDLEKEEKPTIQEQPVKIDIRKELESIEFMGVNDARDSETIARHFYELGRQSKGAEWTEKDIENGSYISAFLQVNCGDNVTLKDATMWFMSRFKQLPIQQSKPEPSKDLKKRASEIYPNKEGDLCSLHSTLQRGGYIRGYQDCKEQMMKEANKALESCDKNTASYKDAFFAGVDWKEREMMKEAVEGIAVINANAKEDGFGYVRSDYVSDDVLRGLGRFKIIIVKED